MSATIDELPSLAGLLARHGLDGAPEEPFETDGWSGARFTRVDRGDAAFVIKRDSLARGWIARSTADGPHLREAWFAAAHPPLPAPVDAPYLGVARDGDELAVLMPDLSGVLFDWSAPISTAQLDVVLDAVAALHAGSWPADLRAGTHWCPVTERLTLICRASLERSGPARDAVGDRILPGWDAFDRLAPAAARDLVNGLGQDPRPLVAALERRPATLIHGDLKLANVGIGPDGAVHMVDWQMVMVAPVAIELGWFLVSNVDSLPLPPAGIVDRYRVALARRPAGSITDVDLDAEFDLAILVGLLLRGWRKGYDTEAGRTLASGVGAADDLAWWCDRAIEAVARL